MGCFQCICVQLRRVSWRLAIIAVVCTPLLSGCSAEFRQEQAIRQAITDQDLQTAAMLLEEALQQRQPDEELLDLQTRLVRASDSAYRQGEGYLGTKAYSEAIAEFSRVVPADPRYQDAQSKLTTARDTWAADLLSEAKKAKTNGSYYAAQDLYRRAKVTGGRLTVDIDREVAALQVLIEKKEAEVQRQLAQLKDDAGDVPEVFANGWMPVVMEYLDAHLKDPSSVQFVSWSSCLPVDFEGEYYWSVKVKYRAKNSFGAYVLETKQFLIQHEIVRHVF